MTDTFGAVLDSKLDTVSLTEIARKMAGKSGNPRTVLSTLSRFRNNDRNPSQKKVSEIAIALAECRNFSKRETENLRADLYRAAGYGDPRISDLRVAARLAVSESEVRRRLHPECEQILRENGYSQIQTERILAAVGASTMKLIIKAHKQGEEIEVVELGELAALGQLVPEESSERKRAAGEPSETVIEAGRARISVTGSLSTEQQQVIRKAAEMIEAVLNI